MAQLPAEKYLIALGESVWEWSDLNLQSAVYVQRSSEAEIDIDEILKLSVEHEVQFVQAMKNANMSQDLIDRRSELSKQRNAFVHSTKTHNGNGKSRLWRPERGSEPARPIKLAEIEKFIADVKSLRTSVMVEERVRFGPAC